MKYPEFLLVPVFMLADYFLTIAGSVLKEREYTHHFKSPHYELNPFWQKQVAQKKWFNPKHIAITVAASSVMIYLIESGGFPEPLPQVILGVILAIYAMLIGRHLSNLAIFGYMNRKPGDISGQVIMSHSLLLWMSLFQNFIVVIPLVMVAILSPSPFVLGAAVGSVLQIAMHLVWIKKHKKKNPIVGEK